MNVDWFELSDTATTGIINRLNFEGNSAETQFDVFDVNGNRILGIRSSVSQISDEVRNAVHRSGIYLVRGKRNGFVKRIRVTE